MLCLIGKSSSGKHGCPFCSAASPYEEKGVIYRLSDLLELNKVYFLKNIKLSQRIFPEVSRKWIRHEKTKGLPKCGQ